MKIFLFLTCLCLSALCKAQTNTANRLSYKTKSGHSINIRKGEIYFDKKSIYKYREDGINYNSRYNRFIEDSSANFLFLVNYDSPNLDKFDVFKVTPTKAIKMPFLPMASKIVDLDSDGFLEFGGTDLTEMYPQNDSMYYRPTGYYEIANGKIHFDSTLTRKKDIELNGIYLKHPQDKDGNCCKVIRKPKH